MLIAVLTPTELLKEVGAKTCLSVLRISLTLKDCRPRGAVGLLAEAVAAVVLTPTALSALVLGLWRIGAGLHWTSSFVIRTGPFSCWETWLGVAALLSWFEIVFNRVAQRPTRH